MARVLREKGLRPPVSAVNEQEGAQPAVSSAWKHASQPPGANRREPGVG